MRIEPPPIIVTTDPDTITARWPFDRRPGSYVWALDSGDGQMYFWPDKNSKVPIAPYDGEMLYMTSASMDVSANIPGADDEHTRICRRVWRDVMALPGGRKAGYAMAARAFGLNFLPGETHRVPYPLAAIAQQFMEEVLPLLPAGDAEWARDQINRSLSRGAALYAKYILKTDQPDALLDLPEDFTSDTLDLLTRRRAEALVCEDWGVESIEKIAEWEWMETTVDELIDAKLAEIVTLSRQVHALAVIATILRGQVEAIGPVAQMICRKAVRESGVIENNETHLRQAGLLIMGHVCGDALRVFLPAPAPVRAYKLRYYSEDLEGELLDMDIDDDLDLMYEQWEVRHFMSSLPPNAFEPLIFNFGAAYLYTTTVDKDWKKVGRNVAFTTWNEFDAPVVSAYASSSSDRDDDYILINPA